MASFTIEGEDVEEALLIEDDEAEELEEKANDDFSANPPTPLLSKAPSAVKPTQSANDDKRELRISTKLNGDIELLRRQRTFPSSPRRSNSLADFLLAVAQDSAKTMITQCFRSCAFLTDTSARILLAIYDNFLKTLENGDSDQNSEDNSALNDSFASGSVSSGNGSSKLPLISPSSATPPEFYANNNIKLEQSSSAAAFDEILREVEEAESLNHDLELSSAEIDGTPIYRADSFLTPLAIYRNRFGQSTPRLESIADKLSSFSPKSWRMNKQDIVSSAKTMLAPLSSEKQTGLFEDIEFFLLERADFSFNWSRDVLAYMRPELKAGSPSSTALKFLPRRLQQCFVKIDNILKKNSDIGPPWPSRKFIDLDKIDILEGVRDVVIGQGYQYEEITVCTNDGYKLRLERIPNRRSRNVLYMQHGVMDSSFTWCCNGADKSLAYIAHDAGYDVFLGNFRGAGGQTAHRHVKKDISDFEFWDFSINEHAFEDIPAFLQAIVNAKARDGFPHKSGEEERVNIVAVAHSMGGAAVLMYLLRQRELRKPHFLDGLLLLSPAGVHIESPLYAHVGGRALDLTFAKMLHSLRLPDDTWTRLATKFVHDVKKNLPAVESLISVMIVKGLGGNEIHPRMGPFSAVQQLTYNLLTCGTSTKVFIHLRQLIANKRFQAFDYEPTAYPRHFHSRKGGNMEAYGTPTPPEYTSKYHLIDVPVHLVAGRGDRLIGPINILVHYDKMRKAGVDVTLESYDGCGHADFTCGLNSSVLRGLINASNSLMDRIQTRKKRLAELRRKKLITGPY